MMNHITKIGLRSHILCHLWNNFMSACDTLLHNAAIIDKFGMQHNNSAVAVSAGKISWVGPDAQLPQTIRDNAKSSENCLGKLITPGFIDCHTHLVYAGNRAEEFEQRLNGLSYVEIARRGGGIISTVRKTRQATQDELIEQSLPRIIAMRDGGVLTVEIKSGYGLDLDTELKMLKVAKKLGEISGVRVITTYLGAHALPEEFRGKRQAYIDYVCKEVLPAVAEQGLADAVDAFCESIGFTIEETEQVFQAAKKLNLPVKCHAEQISNIGASILAINYGALSVDHIEYLDQYGIQAMAEAGTVAVILPGAFYFLKETQKPPVNELRKAGVGMAIATDCNPGSSPTTSLTLMMNMASQFFSMTVAEVLSAVTHQAARALGVANIVGELKVGKQADLLRWAVKDATELCYPFGYPLPHEAMIAGKWLLTK